MRFCYQESSAINNEEGEAVGDAHPYACTRVVTVNEARAVRQFPCTGGRIPAVFRISLHFYEPRPLSGNSGID
jgi:hypothetical protein